MTEHGPQMPYPQCPHCPHEDHSINACAWCDCDWYGGTPGPQRVDYQHVCQRVMQILGPDVPDVDYTVASNRAGLIEDVREALRLLRAAGIEFRFVPRQSRNARDPL
jgi:hypothetical protein